MTDPLLSPADRRALADEITRRRARTVGRIRQLQRDVAALVDATHDSPDDEHDPEGATIGFERAQASTLLADARAQLDALDRAAVELDAGTLGRCEVCGGAIAGARLLARPTARRCVACAD